MLDTYIWGDATRISPEAPVPVIKEDSREFCLGGAANVALNLKSLGAQTEIISIIGNDEKGKILNGLLDKDGIASHLIEIENRPTTSKVRIFARNQQVLRLDHEEDQNTEAEVADQIIEKLKDIEDINIIILQDYDKGCLTADLIQKVIEFANEHNIFISVDPKKRNFLTYKNVDLFKPNLREIKDGLNIDFDNNNLDEIKNAVQQLENTLYPSYSLLTLAEKGIFIKMDQNYHLIPTFQRNISDVSGAGDTVISIASLALYNNLDLVQTAKLSNLAASIVCQKAGVYPIQKEELISQIDLLDELEG